MEGNLLLNQSFTVIATVILVLMILANGLGYRIGRMHSKEAALGEKREKIAGTITGAMLALVGFILAIALSMADTHFQARRKLILDEANAIGTSRLRALTLGGAHGTEIVRLLRDYTQLRLDFFNAGEDWSRIKPINKETSDLQQAIWDHASAIAGIAPTPVSALLLSSLNEVFDLATSRRWALEVRVPPYVINLLLILSLVTIGIMGYYFGVCGVRYPILSGFLFVAFTTAIVLVIDLNSPRRGFIQAEQRLLSGLSRT